MPNSLSGEEFFLFPPPRKVSIPIELNYAISLAGSLPNALRLFETKKSVTNQSLARNKKWHQNKLQNSPYHMS